MSYFGIGFMSYRVWNWLKIFYNAWWEEEGSEKYSERRPDFCVRKVYFDMSKSSQSTKFRGVDVDELDENKFQDEGDEDSGQSGPDEGEVNNLLMQYPCL